jgi:hypothetical protein
MVAKKRGESGRNDFARGYFQASLIKPEIIRRIRRVSELAGKLARH